MAANFIPPIPIGQFKPSSEAIASWLYEVWKYLQENPIPQSSDVSNEATAAAQSYVATNVPPLIAAAIAELDYSDFVTGTSLPVYRASNDEIGPADLLEAWGEGCRFALVDDEEFFIMIKNGETINLLQVLTESQAQGVVSVNGQTGVVVIPTASQSVDGLMSIADKTKLDGITVTTLPISNYLPAGVWSGTPYHAITKYGNIVIVNISGTLAQEASTNETLFNNLPVASATCVSSVVSENGNCGAVVIAANANTIQTRGATWANIGTTYVRGQLIYTTN